MDATRLEVSAGDQGAAETLAIMAELARAGAVDPLVRQVAAALCRRTETNGAEQTRRLRTWLCRHVGFLPDPIVAEGLHRPDLLIRAIARDGRVEVDCDDVAILGAALGMSIGLHARFIALGRDNFEHVFAELGDPRSDEWFELDITRKHQAQVDAYPRSLVLEVA